MILWRKVNSRKKKSQDFEGKQRVTLESLFGKTNYRNPKGNFHFLQEEYSFLYRIVKIGENQTVCKSIIRMSNWWKSCLGGKLYFRLFECYWIRKRTAVLAQHLCVPLVNYEYFRFTIPKQHPHCMINIHDPRARYYISLM